MRSKLHVSGHPLHPMLIPLPIACAIIALVSDIVAMAGQFPNWYFMGYVLTIGMWTTGLLAAIPGLTDYFMVVPQRTDAKKRATLHLLLNVSIVGLYFVSWLVKNSAGGSVWVSRSALVPSLILEIIGVGLLAASGWFGWALVYKHRIGVDDEVKMQPNNRKVA